MLYKYASSISAVTCVASIIETDAMSDDMSTDGVENDANTELLSAAARAASARA